MSSFSDYENFDAMGLAELVRNKDVTPLELLEAAIERAERINPMLNAIVARMYDDARGRAGQPMPEAPLAGVPMLLKDLLSPYPGVRFTSGCRFFRDYVPDNMAELVRRYLAGGLNIFAKTNTPEFGIMPVTEPVLFGACRNPWDLNRTPGGSSGGSAASVAAGIVPIAHGGDGGGSIRIPASCCGVFGLKPSRGRNPAGPDASEHWFGFAAEHVLTRSVRDSAAALDISAGPEITSPYWAPPAGRTFLSATTPPFRKLKIAFTWRPHLPGPVHADCRAALDDAVKLCQELGHDVEEDSFEIEGENFALAFFTVVCGSVASGIKLAEEELGRSAERDELEVATLLAGQLGEQLTASDAFGALLILQHYARVVHRFFEKYDVLLTPTLGGPPLPIGALEPVGAEALAHRTIANLKLGALLKIPRVVRATVNRIFNFVPFSPVANVTGQPSMSVPLYWNADNLPIGTMFTGRLGEEATLFALAAELEQARPWKQRRPQLDTASHKAS